VFTPSSHISIVFHNKKVYKDVSIKLRGITMEQQTLTAEQKWDALYNLAVKERDHLDIYTYDSKYGNEDIAEDLKIRIFNGLVSNLSSITEPSANFSSTLPDKLLVLLDRYGSWDHPVSPQIVDLFKIGVEQFNCDPKTLGEPLYQRGIKGYDPDSGDDELKRYLHYCTVGITLGQLDKNNDKKFSILLTHALLDNDDHKYDAYVGFLNDKNKPAVLEQMWTESQDTTFWRSGVYKEILEINPDDHQRVASHVQEQINNPEHDNHDINSLFHYIDLIDYALDEQIIDEEKAKISLQDGVKFFHSKKSTFNAYALALRLAYLDPDTLIKNKTIVINQLNEKHIDRDKIESYIFNHESFLEYGDDEKKLAVTQALYGVVANSLENKGIPFSRRRSYAEKLVAYDQKKNKQIVLDFLDNNFTQEDENPLPWPRLPVKNQVIDMHKKGFISEKELITLFANHSDPADAKELEEQYQSRERTKNTLEGLGL
jgi:hypothetical protein